MRKNLGKKRAVCGGDPRAKRRAGAPFSQRWQGALERWTALWRSTESGAKQKAWTWGGQPSACERFPPRVIPEAPGEDFPGNLHMEELKILDFLGNLCMEDRRAQMLDFLGNLRMEKLKILDFLGNLRMEKLKILDFLGNCACKNSQHWISKEFVSWEAHCEVPTKVVHGISDEGISKHGSLSFPPFFLCKGKTAGGASPTAPCRHTTTTTTTTTTIFEATSVNHLRKARITGLLCRKLALWI